jgi:uncharacterized coiled-coil protein SlyX
MDFDRQVRRFQQIAELERKLTLQQKAIRDAKAHVKDLQSEVEATVLDIRAAARDEGELPPL